MRTSLFVLSALVLSTTMIGCASAADEDVDASDEALAADWGEVDDDFTNMSESDLDTAAILSDVADDALDAPPGDDAPFDPIADATDPALSGPVGVESAPTRIDLPASCNPATSLDLTVYYERSDRDLLASLAKHANACSRFWIAIPKVAASAANPDADLWPRKVNGTGVHALGPAFRATAEFHWGASDGGKYPGWKNVEVVKEGGVMTTRRIARAKYFRVDWHAKGVLFRQRMAKSGYRTQDGDSWHVNELESTWARSPAYLKAVKELVEGLADGDPDYDAFTDPDPAIQAKTAAEKTAINVSAHKKGVRGVLYLSAIGRRLPGESTDAEWQGAIKQALRRKKFWATMANDVTFWGQERYAGFGRTCTGASLAAQTAPLMTFQEMLLDTARRAPRYKSGSRAGQSTVGTALSYLGRSYTPVINAAWSSFSGDASIPVGRVGDFVAAQVYAARRYDVEHDSPHGRIGVYFRPNVDKPTSDADNARFAERTASVLTLAYDGKDGNPDDACRDGCRCN